MRRRILGSSCEDNVTIFCHMVASVSNMKSHQAYPQYVDSGIPWLGKIPKGWGVKRLKYVADMNRRVLSESTDPDFPMKYVDISNVESGGAIGEPSEYRFADAPSRARRIVKPGDIIVATVRTYLKAIAFFGRPDQNTIVSTGFAVLTATNQLLPKYLYYHSISESFVQHIVANSFGVSYPAITPTLLGSLPVRLPPKSEQQKIAAHLDEKTAAIDGAVEKKRRQVELLKEKRAALINQAITRGLDPKAELVDSGIPWLGKIPKAWKIKKLRHVAEMIVSNVDKLTSPEEVPVRLCNYVDAYKNEVIREGLPFMVATATSHEIVKYRIRIDDVLITKDSEEWSDIGVPAYVATEAPDLISGYHLAILRSHKSLLSGRFLVWQLRGAWAKAQFSCRANGITRYALSHGAIKDLLLAIPSLPDQQKIAAYLDEKMAAIDGAVEKINQSIELLAEYKSSLITNVVTGKVEVV